MGLYISLFFTLIVTLLFILMLRPVALAVGLVDTPGGRKKHKDPTPIVGGIAMFFGLLFGGQLMGDLPSFNWLLTGSSLLILVGVIDDRFELAAPGRLGLVCFRFAGSDDENRELLEAVNSGGEIFLTHTVIPVGGKEKYVLRFATGSISTREEHVRRAREIICSAAAGDA